jgi:hypothetical protein
MSAENWKILQKLQTWAARWKDAKFVEDIKAQVAGGAAPAELAEKIGQAEWYVLRMWKSRFGEWISDAERARRETEKLARKAARKGCRYRKRIRAAQKLTAHQNPPSGPPVTSAHCTL